jgi:integrase
VAEVDAYRDKLDREDRLGAESINKTLVRLGQILDLAVEWELIPRNPVKVNPRNRKLRTPRPVRTFIERPENVELLLEAAPSERARPLLGVLVLAGLRIGECTALTWGDVDLAGGRIHVRRSKTDAGVRVVQLLPRLRELLADYRAGHPDAAVGDLVFPTATGRPLDRGYVNTRLLGGAARRVNALLAERREPELPKLSPHSLRRTYISLLLHINRPVPFVMQQVGHTDPKMTLGIYGKVLSVQDDASVAAVQRLVGSGADLTAPTAAAATVQEAA